MLKNTLVLGLLLAVLAGCFNQEIRVTDEDVVLIGREKLKNMLSGKESVALVDVRPREEFDQEHIPGAISIPIQAIMPGDPRLSDARTIVLYDLNWERGLARAAAKKMLAQQYKGVAVYPGGISEWKASGEPVAK